MRVVFLAVLGAIGGLLVGGAVGLLTGVAWINIFRPGNFEGYAAMTVFFVFTPIGAMVGGFSVPCGLAAPRHAPASISSVSAESM